MADQSKSDSAFRTISEVSEELGVPQHVLRFWETKFSAIKPLKRGGNRRYYRPEDIQLLRAINELLYVDGYTIRGVQKLLRDQGVRTIAAAKGGPLGPSTAGADAPAAAAPPTGAPEVPGDDVAATTMLDQAVVNEPTLEFEPDPLTVNVGLFPLPAKPAAEPAPLALLTDAQKPALAYELPLPAPDVTAPKGLPEVLPEPLPESLPELLAEDHSGLVSNAIARLEAVRARLRQTLRAS